MAKNHGPICFKKSGHCTRCEAPFGGNATAYMVVEDNICWGIDGNIAFTQREIVPVCDACVLPAEAAELTRDEICPGCKQRMRVGLRWRYGRHRRGWVCSSRCRQRVRRVQRRLWRGAVCTGCGMMFNPKRADAKFCSPACRQNAYRKRAAAPSVAPVF
jgi:hypothetical protein